MARNSGFVPGRPLRRRLRLLTPRFRVFWLRMRFASLLVVTLALSLAGCTSFNAHVEPGRDLQSYQRFFVQSNLDDNQGIGAMLVRALQARGREAELGPLTMLPTSAQVLVTFQDRWTWDFRNHMVALRVVVLDARSRQPIAAASFTGPTALTIDAPDVVERLVTDLFAAPASAARRQ